MLDFLQPLYQDAGLLLPVHLHKHKSPSKRRSQLKHGRKRRRAFRARFGKSWRDMSEDERAHVRLVLRGHSNGKVAA